MADFTVGVFAYDGFRDLGGQSFTPNVPGPNGTGTPGTATQVFLRSISLGYPNSNTALRTGKIFVYAQELTDPDQIGQLDYLVGQSGTQVIDGTDLFGSGTYYRKFSITAGLVPSSKYFIYFEDYQSLRYKGSSPYSGGYAQDDSLVDLPTVSAQFQVEMYT